VLFRSGVVIHNGADPVFSTSKVQQSDSRRAPAGTLRFAAASVSPRRLKRHDLIAALADFPDVEVVYFGRWPDGVDAGRVRLQGMASKEKMADEYARCDYFFHPAITEMCSNAILEAVSSGLPVIYNSGPGSSAEIVGENGFALDETNLKETVRTAWARLDELKDVVVRSRGRYSISRAASQYRQVFERAVPERRS